MVTEATLSTLRVALHNVEHLRALACGERPPVVSISAIAGHVLRDLAAVAGEIDAALDAAAAAAVEERYGLTPAGAAALVAAGLARDRVKLQAAGPTAPLLA
jgi:hypothetical protein